MTTERNQFPGNLKVKFTPTAAQEVRDIIRHMAKESPKAAQHVREALISKTKEVLTANPFLGRLLSEYPEYEKKGVRRYLPLAHYSILYFVTNDTVEIWMFGIIVVTGQLYLMINEYFKIDIANY